MKRALVTGGSGDLGGAIARRLARDGLHVIVHANSRLAAAGDEGALHAASGVSSTTARRPSATAVPA